MKKSLMLSVLFMAVVMSASAASPDSKRTVTVPRAVSGALESFFSFLPKDYDADGLGPWDLVTISDAIGVVDHLGVTVMHTEQRPWADGSATDGQVTITAANGDEIHGTYVGVTLPAPEPGHLIGKATFIIDGGTGRFAHASGEIEATAFITMGTIGYYELWPATWVLDGTIDY
jgi:hypothetical protein